MEYAGDLITPKEAEVRDEKYSKNTDKYGSYMYYFVHKGTKWCIDATIESGKYGRLLNHSRKTPNCTTKILEVRLLREGDYPLEIAWEIASNLCKKRYRIWN